jgi:hypothetical protein
MTVWGALAQNVSECAGAKCNETQFAGIWKLCARCGRPQINRLSLIR